MEAGCIGPPGSKRIHPRFISGSWCPGSCVEAGRQVGGVLGAEMLKGVAAGVVGLIWAPKSYCDMPRSFLEAITIVGAAAIVGSWQEAASP